MSLIILFGCAHQAFGMKIEFETLAILMQLLLFGRRPHARQTYRTNKTTITNYKTTTTTSASQPKMRVVVTRAPNERRIKFVLNCFELVMDARTRTHSNTTVWWLKPFNLFIYLFFPSMNGARRLVRQSRDHSASRTKSCFAYEMIYDKLNAAAQGITVSLYATLYDSASVCTVHGEERRKKKTRDGFAFNTLITIRINNNIL